MYVARVKSGRCRSGGDQSGSIFHAVLMDAHEWFPAACGTRPGFRGNGWSGYIGSSVTCLRCIKAIQEKQRELGESLPVVTGMIVL
jgi:hypothetical protein